MITYGQDNRPAATAAAGNSHARAADAAAEAAAADDACASHAVEESDVQRVVDNSGKPVIRHKTIPPMIMMRRRQTDRQKRSD